MKAFNEAENYNGPAIIIAYARRPLWAASPLLRNLPFELLSSVHLHRAGSPHEDRSVSTERKRASRSEVATGVRTRRRRWNPSTSRCGATTRRWASSSSTRRPTLRSAMSAFGLDPGQVRHGLVREERDLEGTRREPLQAAREEGRPGEGGSHAPDRRAGLQGELRSPQEVERDVSLTDFSAALLPRRN